jgi:hypothetical protein
MQNIQIDTKSIAVEDQARSLQSYFKPTVSPEDVEQVFLLKQAQPLLQGFTALFHGGGNAVMVRLLVLRELVADVSSSQLSRGEINQKLAYLDEDSLETVLSRFRTHQLLAWDAAKSIYRVTPLARSILAAIDSLLLAGTTDDDADMGYLLSQVAGAHAVGGITAEQLQHLLGRLNELTDEFRDAIASGSEFQLRAAQAKWHSACDWVEKGSTIIHAITTDANADAQTHRAAQAIGRAQSMLLNMQGMFSRALNQIERQRVHLGQSGLSTTDIKSWLLAQEDLASLAAGAIVAPVKPLFITPAEMIDVAESELMADRVATVQAVLPQGEDASVSIKDTVNVSTELNAWLSRLDEIVGVREDVMPVEKALLPATFAVASYRASLLPLLGDESEAALQGGTAAMARLPLNFAAQDDMVSLNDAHIKAISKGTLTPIPTQPTKTNHE